MISSWEDKGEIEELSPAALQEANEWVERCAPYLGRNAPKKDYVKQLIQRNFYQIKTAECCYAVTRWNLQGGQTREGQVGGGTGWAVGMAILRGLEKIYLFDMERQQWYQYRHHWIRIDPQEVPRAQGRYAGIGSRQLDQHGKEAIRWIYRK
jgi:hypothetical protein